MTDPTESAFRRLHRALTRRRIFSDLRLRLELLLLAVIAAAFLFWQARVAFDSVSRTRGPLGITGIVIVIWVLLALTAGFLAGSRHARQLTRRAPGPGWLALPLAPRDLARHLRWEARTESRWLLAPAAGVLAASFGLIPLWALALLGIAFPILSAAADRLGCSIAFRVSLGSAEPRPGLPPLLRLMATAARPVPVVTDWRARWRRLPVWRTLWAKDLKLGTRSWESRRLLITPIVLAVLSVLVWTLPVDAAAARLMAFALALIASATLGEWLVALSGRDPFWILRGIPIGVTAVWGTRAAWGLLWGAGLAAAHAIAASPLSPPALELFIGWTGTAALVIVVLAVNYSLTLFPHAAAAQRLFNLALGVAIAVSLMIPLLGWVALLAALLHSARRLPRWARSEEAP